MNRELAADMLAAADTLEAASRLFEAFSPPDFKWSAKDLRREAPHVED